MKTASELQRLLRSIDHKGYPAYKDTKGTYQFDGYVLSIDHVQGDPFASPSKISVHIDGKTAGFPKECYELPERRISMQDYILRLFKDAVEKFNFKAKGSGKSGLLSVSKCGQEILERTAASMDSKDGSLIIRLEAGFPAHGRTICSGELEKILFDFLPRCVKSTLYYKSLNTKAVQNILYLADDRSFIRNKLPELGLVAFIADGSILPRQSGVSDRPMKNGIPFQSPDSMKVTLSLPHRGTITGMGIKKGITLIVGGGYHGKSTLLNALEVGVYDHIEGDGREFVITDADAVKIRAEDGRSVKNADISMFINHLPNGKDTVHFSTEDASGSTSQAANVIEAIESGTSALLIDEDTSATNFMVRDALMQKVISKDKEPITPFIDRIRLLYEQYGISTILVAESSGAFFFVADSIIQMDNYIPKDITEAAKKEAAENAGFYNHNFSAATNHPQKYFHFPDFSTRKPVSSGIINDKKKDFGHIPDKGYGKNHGRGYGSDNRTERTKIKSMGQEAVSLNKETINLHYVEQLVDNEQTAALGYMLAFAQKELFHGNLSVQEVVDKLLDLIHKKGLSAVVEGNYLPSGLAMPRKQEIFACFNRYRGLILK